MTAYVDPASRPAEWARMATDLATAGRTTEQIADVLCIDEATVLLLLVPEPAPVEAAVVVQDAIPLAAA